jgi:hypothetical protein
MPREPAPHIVHFAADGGINAAYLVDQLSGNGQSIGDLAFIISIAPEANGGATLDLENNTLTGVEQVVPSPDNHGQLKLDGLLAFVPQTRPAVPATGGVLYVDAADGALKFVGSSGPVTTIAPG